jgi:ligand-binding sensor domain-containing protein/signal transduction histidine kinase/DNA-binding response OmpR family regulator
MFSRTAILLLFGLGIAHAASAQTYYFKNYQGNKGVASNNITCITQDKKGFMWFGGRKGLYRFDGYSSRVFRNSNPDSSGIGSNSIMSLYEDPSETMWVGTSKGIYLYDPAKEIFTLFTKVPAGQILAIRADNQQNIWIISNGILYQYNISRGTVENYGGDIASICISPSGIVWAATNNGILKKYNRAGNNFENYNLSIFSKDGPVDGVRDIYPLEDTAILVGTFVHAYSFNTRKPGLTNIFENDRELNHVQVHSFIRYAASEIWIGTETGLYIYNTQTRKGKRIQKQYNNPYSITDNVVFSFYKDKEGGTWIGTYFGGVNYYSKEYNVFKKYLPQPGVANSLQGNIIHEIVPDQYGDLWIGTEDAGLNKLNLKTGQYKHYGADKQKGDIVYSNIHGLMASGNELWIGTLEHGLDVMDIPSGKVIRHYQSGKDSNALKSDFIITIQKTRNGDILIGTRTGMYRYNRDKNNFSSVPFFNMQIHSIHEDDEGTLWVGAVGSGVYYYNPITKKQGQLQQNSANHTGLLNGQISSLFEDSRHKLWICTQEGLSQYDRISQRITNFTMQNGLPDNQVFSVKEDDDKNIWVSTAKGLAVIDPNNYTIRTYKGANGLPSEQFNYRSSYKSPSGDLFFGTINGMISFNPANIEERNFTPPVFITGIQVNNKDFPIGTDALQTSIIYTKEITLPYFQSSINLDVAALSYNSPELNEYMYKMDNFDKGWTLLKSNRRIYYTQLPPGNYLFRIKGSTGNGKWNPKETTLHITILPPFWATTWAYLFYLLVGGTIIFILLRSYYLVLNARNNRKIDLFEREKEREIYNAKIEFFTNVAHEIRTPLTLIKMPLDKLLSRQTLDSETEESLNIMKKSTNRLIALTNQLLDFRKAEENKFSLTFTKADINEMLEEMHSIFKTAADQKSLHFTVEMPRITLHAFVDEEAVKKIIVNLFNNAIKYADKKASVRMLPFSSDDTMFHIEFKNDGYKIPYDLREKIFEPFFRIKETEKEAGTGVGLPLAKALVELHKGNLELRTTKDEWNLFILSLPIHQDMEIDLKNTSTDEVKNENEMMTCPEDLVDMSKPIILVVEDNKEILSFIQRELWQNYQTRFALNGQQALEVLEKENVQLVISDIMMPVMDGIELCRKIKTDIQFSHIPIILLTARNSLHSKIEGLEAGADAYIEKPFSFDHLNAQITNLITNRNIIKEYFARSPLTHLKGMAYSQADKQFIEKLNAVIEENIMKLDLEVQDLSKIMNMSRPTLYRKIKALSNLTPNELISLSRLKKAAELLAEGKYKINEVAYMVGYTVHANFSRDFHKQFGVTPSAYVNSIKVESPV